MLAPLHSLYICSCSFQVGQPQQCWLLQASFQHYGNWCKSGLWFQLEADHDLNLVIRWVLSLCKSLPQSEFLQGKGSQGGLSVAVQVPHQLSCSAYTLYAVTFPYSTEECPSLRQKCLCSPLMALFSEYPPTLLIVSKCHSFSSEGAEARERLGWGWDDPKIHPLMETKKSCNTCSCVCRMTQTPGLSLCHWHQVVCSSACAACVWGLASLVAAAEAGPACLVGMCFALGDGGQKFAIKWCHESFNLSTCNYLSLKRLLWKKGNFSVQSCSSTAQKHKQVPVSEWTDQEGMAMLWEVWLTSPFNTLTL